MFIGPESRKRERAMKVINVSDELYESLKSFVADPFDDTPETVISRLMDIAAKAKDRWSRFEVQPKPQQSIPAETNYPGEVEEDRLVVL